MNKPQPESLDHNVDATAAVLVHAAAGSAFLSLIHI